MTVACDDGDACTVDTCDPVAGCIHTPITCDDADPCTTDSCDPANGQCVYIPVLCDDNNACTTDSCDPASGQCVYIPGTPASPLGNTLRVNHVAGTTAQLDWVDPPGPFDVYRGSRAAAAPFAYNQTCFASPVAGPTVDDASVPSNGALLYYLVSRENACGESAIGYDSTGAPIANTSPCP